MQIITIEDSQFPELLIAWKDGKCIGRFWRNGKPRTVCATRQFLLVSSENGTSKFAVKPTTSIEESLRLAIQLLKREEERGNPVERLDPSSQPA